MKDKKLMRLRRAKKTRFKIKELRVFRLSIHKTPKHIYAQVISSDGHQTCAAASTLDKDLRTQAIYSGNVKSAAAVGKLVAERAKEAGVTKVAFDRSGFQYHGRVKALADAAREAGLDF